MSRIALSLLALLVVGGCSATDGTGPSSTGATSFGRPALARTYSDVPRSGALHVTKECSQYTRLAGSFCTITSSSLPQLRVGSRVVYAVAAGPTVLDSDITLYPPDPGSPNLAFGHCRLEFATGVGACSFSGGTGRFTGFTASAAVTFLGRPNWGWNGTYSFIPRD